MKLSLAEVGFKDLLAYFGFVPLAICHGAAHILYNNICLFVHFPFPGARCDVQAHDQRCRREEGLPLFVGTCMLVSSARFPSI